MGNFKKEVPQELKDTLTELAALRPNLDPMDIRNAAWASKRVHQTIVNYLTHKGTDYFFAKRLLKYLSQLAAANKVMETAKSKVTW